MSEFIKRAIQKIIKSIILFREDIHFDTDHFNQDQGPFLFLSNHVTNWDAFYLSVPIDDIISFVCSDRFFKIWPLGHILRFFDAVPKTKNKSDLRAIRHLIDRKNRGMHIGIFPEGGRSWDGHTEPIFISTAKLIKLLKMPVVIVNIQGGNLSNPRWAESKRKGRISLRYTRVLTPEEIDELDVDQVFSRITEALEHREEEEQAKDPVPYKGRKRAESLERLLFICPECQAFDSLHSKKHDLTCNVCGYQVQYTEYGFLDLVSGNILHFDTVSRWNDWQKDELKENLLSLLGEAVFSKSIYVKTFDKEGRLKGTKSSNLKLDERGLYCEGEWYEMSRLSGVNVQGNHMLEFYTDDALLKRVYFHGGLESVNKWTTAIIYLKKGV